VVTYTGNGGGQNIAHNLGATPGCIIIKETSGTRDWVVYHRSTGNTQGLYLNTTDAAITSVAFWDNTSPTSTQFTVSFGSRVNTSGATYVAYLFAHDAGGFGLTGTDNVISCGSFTTDGSAVATVTLGYEPQWVLIKNIQTDGNNWFIWDVMRGWTTDGTTGDFYLIPNSSAAEGGGADYGGPNATGFTIRSLQSSNQFIYIAIRRGPMKVPTTGTSVFTPLARSGNGSNTTITAGFPVDLALTGNRGAVTRFGAVARLTNNRYLVTMTTQLDQISANAYQANTFDSQIGVNLGTTSTLTNDSSSSFINYMMARAPGFMDVVCYTGNDVFNRNVPQNLQSIPEFIIVKGRNTTFDWPVYSAPVGFGKYQSLNTAIGASADGGGIWGNASGHSNTTFQLGNSPAVNGSGNTYVAYLFASCPGVSKVFNYTGNGSSQTINCGFTSGARFVLIKRTDSSGNWWVWDSARGIVAGNDPYIDFNSSSAEITTNDSVDADSTGFVVNQVAATNVNVSSATYIGLAIA
jgi:hypothetical protein